VIQFVPFQQEVLSSLKHRAKSPQGQQNSLTTELASVWSDQKLRVRFEVEPDKNKNENKNRYINRKIKLKATKDGGFCSGDVITDTPALRFASMFEVGFYGAESPNPQLEIFNNFGDQVQVLIPEGGRL